MLIGGILLGLIAGLLAGGSIGNLASIRLRWIGLLFLAVVVRFATEWAIEAGFEAVDAARLPLFAMSFGLLLAGLWANRAQPGLSLAFIGILLNTIAILANGGHMPVWQPSFIAAGFGPDTVLSPFHRLLEDDALTANFLLHAGPLGDILPIPIPFIRNVASIGDLFLSAGLGFFLFATVLRSPAQAIEEDAEARLQPSMEMAGPGDLAHRVRATDLGRRVQLSSGLASGLAEASVLARPVLLGGSGAGLSPGSSTGGAVLVPTSVQSSGAIPVPRPGAEVSGGLVRHPFVRLALNSSFSALWVGQLISLFGDRIHQIALAFLVLAVTNSPIAVAFVFVFASLPNLFLSPIAGTYVDRWDQKDVMVVSDLLRAAVILVMPIAAVTNILLVYPLIFLITSISIFFRPARVAALPRIVRKDELLTANSAMWVGETIADVIGYPLAAVFVGFLGQALPLAFWIDAATYAASAALIATINVPPLRDPSAAAAERPSVLADLKTGYRFLRNETVLFANTIQAAVAQLTIGVLTVLTAAVRGGNRDRANHQRDGRLRLPRDRHRGRQPRRRVRHRLHRHAPRPRHDRDRGLHGLGRLRRPACADRQLRDRARTDVRLRHRKHGLRDPEPDDVPGADAARHARPGDRVPVRARLRVDDRWRWRSAGSSRQFVGVSPVIFVFGLLTMFVGLAGLLVPAVRNA